MKKQEGITLIALVITIIILLILAGVAISMITGGEGLFAQANDAATKYNQAAKNEADIINQLLNGNYLNGGGNGRTEGPAISNDSYVGYYADLNPNDGKIDGIIFADLAVGGSGQWINADGAAYTIPVKTGLKEYYVSKEDHEGAFGTRDVLSPKTGATGEDRFYIIALENIGGTTIYTWYNAAYEHGMEDYAEATSVKFGTGRANTNKMIEYWNNKIYGEQNTNTNGQKDMWGEIQEKVKEGWFVPSKEEWSACLKELEITQENCMDYGIKYDYWSCSQYDTKRAWGVYVFCGGFGNPAVNIFNNGYGYRVRLANTF